jgi:hypothetical protein
MTGRSTKRLIAVGGQEYSWSFGRKVRLYEGKPHHLLTVVDAARTQQALHVLVRHDDPWLHFAELAHSRAQDKNMDALVTRPMTPALVARIITLAREAGWDCRRAGPSLEFVLAGDARLIPQRQSRDEDAL